MRYALMPLCLLLVTSDAQPAAARCAPTTVHIEILDRTVAADGAVFLRAAQRSRRRVGSAAASFPDRLRLRDASGRVVRLRRQTISSTLSAYVGRRALAPGTYRVVGSPGGRIRVRRRRNLTPTLAAPGSAVLQHETYRAGTSRTRTRLRLEWTGETPAGAVALAVEENGVRWTVPLPETSAEVHLSDFSGVCQRQPEGMRTLPTAGASVQVRFVDYRGGLGDPLDARVR